MANVHRVGLPWFRTPGEEAGWLDGEGAPVTPDLHHPQGATGQAERGHFG